MVSVVTAALTWGALAAGFVFALAAVVRMAAPDAGIDEVRGVILLPPEVTRTIITLFVLAVFVLLADVVRRSRSRRGEGGGLMDRAFEAPRIPAWLRALTQILSILGFMTFAYLLSRTGALSGLLSLGAAVGPGGVPGLTGDGPVLAPPLFIWTFGVLALAAGLGTLALAMWVALGDRPAPSAALDDEAGEESPEPLQTAVEDSLEDLRAEPDPRRAIIRCYARFERVAATSGVARPPWATPMEFMREALYRLPVPRAAVPTLTGLFELARFSQHALGTGERDRAVAALDEIRAAVAPREPDAGAR
jgi:hypothetical protein